MNKVIACDHVCLGDCRRIGCNCECGEFHQGATTIKVTHLASDYPNDTPSVDDLLAHLGKQTGFSLDNNEDEGDRIAADYADANPLSKDEE